MKLFNKIRTKIKHNRSRLNKKVEDNLPQEAGPSYSLIEHIEEVPYHKKSPNARDELSREFLETHIDTSSISNILPGQLIIFKYFEPKTKEELEYWDSYPTTIFFNVIKTEEGRRVLGFNIHYYPPKIRFQVMTKIFDIYKPIYTKYFTSGTTKEIDAFDYRYLMSALEAAKLDFGVRMYIPELIKDVRRIPPQMWHVAVFTEGWFKKRTREAILKYWKRWTSGYKNAYKKHQGKKN